METLYVIPVVATMSLALAVLVGRTIGSGWPRWTAAVGAIFMASLALSGYQIFETVYRSAILPKENDRAVVDSLYYKQNQRIPLPKFIYREIQIAIRLIDFSIRDFCNATRRAFHLSIVAIVTLETITPSLYEYVFPQQGYNFAYGGVGQILLQAQTNSSFPTILSMICIILLFDYTVVSVLSWLLRRRYLRHYEGQAS